jgi:chorismate-pyruvate lyase
MPDLDELVGCFYQTPAMLGVFQEVPPTEVPPVYRRLLEHDQHMTVTLEAFHGCPVEVELIHRHITSSHYTRNTLLRRASDGRVVQFGIARLRFACLPRRVREEIEAAETPMGRILIQHNMLREVQLTGLWRLMPGPQLIRLFGLDEPKPAYGRTALIFCDGEPAVQVLEVMPPDLGNRHPVI